MNRQVGPLEDLVVIDLSRALAGPHAAMMLGDLGARVIKVERPGAGDDTRVWGPPIVGPPDDPISTYFLSCNRNKESITLDLKSEDGVATLARLVTHGDVLVENFRPGVLDRLGFSVERLHELNPALVILSISGFGHDGPEGARAGYDQIAQGEGGLMSLTGPDPEHATRVGVPIADLLAGEVPHAQGNHHPSICPYGTFTCADGTLQIAVGSEGLWQRFALEFGLDPKSEGFATNTERVGNREAVVTAINAVF